MIDRMGNARMCTTGHGLQLPWPDRLRAVTEFARHILERYTGVSRYVPSLETVFNATKNRTAIYYQMISQQNVSHLEMHVHPSVRMPASVQTRPLSVQRPLILRTPGPIIRPQNTLETFVKLLTTRSERIIHENQPISSQPNRATSPVDQPHAPAPALQIVYRTYRPESDRLPEGALPEQLQANTSTPSRISDNLPIAPSIDVREITNQVLHMMDQRLIAQAERYGRSR